MYRTRKVGRPVLLALGLTLILALPMGATAANAQYSGRAKVVDANVLGIPIVISDTGPLPSSGGALETSLLEAEYPGLLQASVLHASTVGQGNNSRAEASVLDVTLTVGGNTIEASLLMARASASCPGPTVSGRSHIAELVINGQAITVSGSPNQTIALPVGTVTINEQNSSVSGQYGEMTVNALHVVIPGVADVVISSAHADITCTGQAPKAKDFVTGGGWITGTPTGDRGTFGVAGGIKNGALWGHLTYIDHGNGLKVKGTGVTSYTVTGTNSRRIEGTATINGAPGTYTVDVADNGEPGKSDTFSITLSTGYTASGTLRGGNIQLHTN
jgi:hypothetical protein